MFDFFLDGCVLLTSDHRNVPTTKDDKIEMAREETNRLKKLLSALRYLWRNGLSTGVSTFVLFCMVCHYEFIFGHMCFPKSTLVNVKFFTFEDQEAMMTAWRN